MKLDLLLSDFWRRGPELRKNPKPRGISRCSVVFGYISPSGERSTFGDPDEEKDRRDIICCHVEVLPSLRVGDGGLGMVLSGTGSAVELVLDG